MREESQCSRPPVSCRRSISNVLCRSAEQVTGRLDRLVERVRNIQRPYMHGEKPVDVVLVSSPAGPSLAFGLTPS